MPLLTRAPAPGLLTAAPRWLNAGGLALLFLVVRRPRSIAKTLALLSVRKFQQAVQSERLRVHGGLHVADFGEALRHGGEGEVAGVAIGDFVPRDRCRDARVRFRANGIGARDGAVLGVLVVIEEDAVALLFPPLAGRQRGYAAFDFAGEGQRGAADVFERPALLDAHVDVQPARA